MVGDLNNVAVIYVCVVCKRQLNPDEEDVHVVPGEEAYCRHCWGELGRWLGQFGLSMEENQ